MMPKKLLSLVFIRMQNKILLGLKKRGFGQGKWNGFGGKVEPNETLLQGAIREVQEECGLTPIDLRRVGFLEFEFEGDPTMMEVHVFETDKFRGEVTESEEMQPVWYEIKNIPYDKMWPDDAYWFPYLLRGEPFKGYFLYRGLDLILKHKLEKLDLSKFKDV